MHDRAEFLLPHNASLVFHEASMHGRACSYLTLGLSGSTMHAGRKHLPNCCHARICNICTNVANDAMRKSCICLRRADLANEAQLKPAIIYPIKSTQRPSGPKKCITIDNGGPG
ncbi:hypothetical protein TWF730_009092 [Orbilia blumenaviensis]|uniref:Uncharacterized protein n=1 Tax=Orbilia blumenaviensis TaxID=1796055 RepID=A0AAV9V3W2_9PEZI